MIGEAARDRRGAVAVLAAVAVVIAAGSVAGGRSASAGGEPSRDDVAAQNVQASERAGWPDEAVVERVPVRARIGRVGELAALEARQRAAPRDGEQAVRLARLQIEEARRSGEARWLGRAEATLAPWWGQRGADVGSLPPDVLLLRATILQARHEFDAALADLDLLLSLRPDEPQGLLVRSVVLTVRGRFAEARSTCERLASRASEFVEAACLAPVEAVTGGHARAAARLGALVSSSLSPGERAWALGILGDVALARGATDAAERAWRRALAVNRDDAWARLALADLLLDAGPGRAGEVLGLLEGCEADDGSLLRIAIAARAIRAAGADAKAAELASRFAAARARGDQTHMREEARYTLSIAGDAQRALRLALAGWESQREVWDARLVLEAARAAGHPAAARPVLTFMERTGFGTAKLRELAAALTAPATAASTAAAGAVMAGGR